MGVRTEDREGHKGPIILRDFGNPVFETQPLSFGVLELRSTKDDTQGGRARLRPNREAHVRPRSTGDPVKLHLLLRSTGVQEYRSTGVQEYRSTGVLECWSAGVLECLSA